MNAIGQMRFVLLVALAWFVLLGLLPLPSLQAHAMVPAVVPIVLACVLICGLLVGDIVWHHAQNGFFEQAGLIDATRLERRRRALTRFVVVPLVLPSIDVFFDFPQPGKPGVVAGVLAVLALLMAALMVLERAMKMQR